MSKVVTIEVPDGYDQAITYTLIGHKYVCGVNTFTNAANLNNGTIFVLDQNKLKDGTVYHVQK